MNSKNNLRLTVTRLHNKDDYPHCSCGITSPEVIPEILELKAVCNSLIKEEKRKKYNGPTQCTRCDFGHTKTFVENYSNAQNVQVRMRLEIVI